MRQIPENNKYSHSQGQKQVHLPQKARIRCPYCFQIFQTFRQEFTDERPEFQCSICHEQFCISAQSQASVILGQAFGHFKTFLLLLVWGFLLKYAPRCTEEVPSEDAECRFCGVVFIKMIEGVESTFQLRGDLGQSNQKLA